MLDYRYQYLIYICGNMQEHANVQLRYIAAVQVL